MFESIACMPVSWAVEQVVDYWFQRHLALWAGGVRRFADTV